MSSNQFSSASASASASASVPRSTSTLAVATSALLASRARYTPAASTSLAFSQAAASASASAAPASRQASQQFASASIPASRLSRSSTTARTPVAFNSSVEQALVNASAPLAIPAEYEVQVGQFRGLQLNKDEENAFKGPISLSRYAINDDPNPELIKKRLAAIKYTQEVAIRRLQPPNLPKPGDLIIKEVQRQLPAAPPVVLRQEGNPAAPTPAPLVIRQAPPRQPAPIREQTVEVEGKPLPPPARKVVVERFPDAPCKPPNVLIEKWLPYGPQKRRVVFKPACAAPPPNPRNLIIEWQQPPAEVEQVCKDLGVCKADPAEYQRRFGSELKQDVPDLCGGGDDACVNYQAEGEAQLELVGDLHALARVDLDAVGLGEYKRFLQN